MDKTDKNKEVAILFLGDLGFDPMEIAHIQSLAPALQAWFDARDEIASTAENALGQASLAARHEGVREEVLDKLDKQEMRKGIRAALRLALATLRS